MPESDVARVVREKKRFVLCPHYNPDGDATGSVLGLADILDHMGKETLCFFEAPVPAIYRFLPGAGRAVSDIKTAQAFFRAAGSEGALITLDCGDDRRVGRHREELLAHRPVLVIDHHHSNPGFGDYNWVDGAAAATGEMVFGLARTLGATISPEAATCLYAAISTDTGSFQYAAATGHTFNVAAELVRLGADPAEIANKLYNNYSLGRLRLMREVLATLEMHERDRIAFIRVSKAMRDRTYTTMEDIEYFVNYPRAIQSVRAAVFLKEIEPGKVSVSLRAKGQCDVSKIAAQFGGGGHKNAAGFTLRDVDGLDAVRDALLPPLAAAVKDAPETADAAETGA